MLTDLLGISLFILWFTLLYLLSSEPKKMIVWGTRKHHPDPSYICRKIGGRRFKQAKQRIPKENLETSWRRKVALVSVHQSCLLDAATELVSESLFLEATVALVSKEILEAVTELVSETLFLEATVSLVSKEILEAVTELVSESLFLEATVALISKETLEAAATALISSHHLFDLVFALMMDHVSIFLEVRLESAYMPLLAEHLSCILQIAVVMSIPWLSDALVSLIEAMILAGSPTKLALRQYEVPSVCTKCNHDQLDSLNRMKVCVISDVCLCTATLFWPTLIRFRETNWRRTGAELRLVR